MRGFGRSLVAAALAASALAGCGSGGHVGGHLDVQGQTTPAAAVYMSVAINGRQLLISPQHIGAGQAIFNVANNNGRPVTLLATPLRRHVVVSVGGQRVSFIDTRVAVGRIPANGTIQVKVNLRPGAYALGTPPSGLAALGQPNRRIRVALLHVGPPRPGGDSSISHP